MTLVEAEQLVTPTHIEIIGLVVVPFVIAWLDTRNQSKRHHQEWMAQQQIQHQENSQRLTRIETSLDPIVDWWNFVRGKERNGGQGN